MLQLSSGKFVLHDVVKNVLDSVSAQLKEKTVMVEVVSDNGVHENQDGDYMYLEKMLRILVDNAVKNLDIGVLSICFSEKVDFDGVLLLNVEVRDSGCGLTDDKAFELMTQYSEIGLQVESVLGVGTICSFTMESGILDDEIVYDMSDLTKDFYMPYNKSAQGMYMPAKEDKSSFTVQEIDTSGLPEIADINWDYAVMFSQSPEISLFTAKNFYQSIDKEIAEIKTLYGDIFQNGVDPYRIRVHGLKGATATFGALQISSLARLLEFAARDKNINRINVLHPILISELQRIKEEWSALAEPEEEVEECFDLGLLKGYVDDMKLAMNSLDIDKADSIMEELKKLSFGDKFDEYIHELGEAVTAIDDAAAMTACDQILEALWN